MRRSFEKELEEERREKAGRGGVPRDR